jgi:Rrf2 family cysteine metabolism transcriptional repressor
MFRVSKAEEQGLRLVMRLAGAGRQQTLSELAQSENLPEPTVAKLLGILRRGGVVDAVRGRNGGYILADIPARLSAGKVVRCINGDPIFSYPCPDRSNGDCSRNEDCGLRPVWRHLARKVVGVLDGTSIADLLQSEEEAARDVVNLWPEES